MRMNTVIWIVLVVIGLFSLAIGFALVWHIWWLAISGLLGVVATLIIRSYDDDVDYTICAETVAGMDGTPTPARTLDLQEGCAQHQGERH